METVEWKLLGFGVDNKYVLSMFIVVRNTIFVGNFSVAEYIHYRVRMIPYGAKSLDIRLLMYVEGTTICFDRQAIMWVVDRDDIGAGLLPV